MYILSFSDKFQKQVKKLIKANPSLKSQIRKTVRLLAKDINHPSLRLHKLSGEKYWSISVNKRIRIIASWSEDRLNLLRIGTHEEVY